MSDSATPNGPLHWTRTMPTRWSCEGISSTGAGCTRWNRIRPSGEQLLIGAEADLETGDASSTRITPAPMPCLSHLYTNVLSKTGVDVVLAARTALEKDAYLSNADVILNRLVLGYYDLGQFPDADKWCREGQRRFPRHPRLRGMPAAAHGHRSSPNPTRRWPGSWRTRWCSLTPDQRERRYAKLNGRVLVAGVLARAGSKTAPGQCCAAPRTIPRSTTRRDCGNTARVRVDPCGRYDGGAEPAQGLPSGQSGTGRRLPGQPELVVSGARQRPSLQAVSRRDTLTAVAFPLHSGTPYPDSHRLSSLPACHEPRRPHWTVWG